MNRLLKQAFTLIELLVVIAIVGILSGLIVVSMGGITQKANIAKAQVFSNSLRNSLMLNIVAEWKFDGYGKNNGEAIDVNYIKDTWGTNHGATITGAPKVATDCISGSCLYFDGPSSSISGTIDLSQAIYTVEGWVKIPSSTTGATGRYLLDLGGGSYPKFSPGTSTSYKPLLYKNSSNYKYGNTDLRDDKWHHIVFISTGPLASDIANDKIWVDGKVESVWAVQSSTSPIAPNGSFVIGNGNYFGYMDGLRVYNVALSSSQIQEQYYVGLNKLLATGQLSRGEYQDNILKLSQYSANK
jgi:prepilin-type N-terminal cleavage/methylation domain-containing protein